MGVEGYGVGGGVSYGSPRTGTNLTLFLPSPKPGRFQKLKSIWSSEVTVQFPHFEYGDFPFVSLRIFHGPQSSSVTRQSRRKRFGVSPLTVYLWTPFFGVSPLTVYLWTPFFGVSPLTVYLWTPFFGVSPLTVYLWTPFFGVSPLTVYL